MASERIVSADEARALREKWHRYDGPYEVSPDDTGDLVIHYEDTIVARIEDFDEHSEPLARLFASAPDDVKMLARTVEVLLAAVSDLRTDNARLDDVAKSALDDLARVRAELDAYLAAEDGLVTILVVMAARYALVRLLPQLLTLDGTPSPGGVS